MSRSIVRTLRSRRLAVTLIALLALYGVIGTLVPLGPPEDPRVSEWAAQHPMAGQIAMALGLHSAFSSPPFLLLASLLAVSTAACAAERTRRAISIRRSMGSSSSSVAKRLRDRAPIMAAIPDDTDPQIALHRARTSLQSVGLKSGSGDSTFEARSGTIGLLGSPLFHWSLAAVIVVIAAGQATRAEGYLPLPAGERVAETHAEYLGIVEGPLFGERHTGIELEVREIDRTFVVDGVDYGPSPFVTAYRDGLPVKSGWIHPNSPLRVGPLMIHMESFGPAAVFSVESAWGAEIGRDTIEIEQAEESVSTVAREFALQGLSGTPVSVRAEVVVFEESDDASRVPGASRAIVATAAAGTGAYGADVTLAEGDSLELGGGERLRLVDVKDWAKVTVANDWSVPFVYGLLVSAIVGLFLALLVPTRRVSVMLVSHEAGSRIHAVAWHALRDAEFTGRIEGIIRHAAEGSE